MNTHSSDLRLSLANAFQLSTRERWVNSKQLLVGKAITLMSTTVALFSFTIEVAAMAVSLTATGCIIVVVLVNTCR